MGDELDESLFRLKCKNNRGNAKDSKYGYLVIYFMTYLKCQHN